MGDVAGGLRIKWKGPGQQWDNPAYTGVSSWSNGTIAVTNASVDLTGSQSSAGPSDLVRISATAGPITLTAASPSRSFHLDL